MNAEASHAIPVHSFNSQRSSQVFGDPAADPCLASRCACGVELIPVRILELREVPIVRSDDHTVGSKNAPGTLYVECVVADFDLFTCAVGALVSLPEGKRFHVQRAGSLP